MDKPAVRLRGLFGILALGTLLAGCAQQLTPQDVADRFWRAVVTGHPAKIRRYVLAEDRELLEAGAELLPITAFKLGRVVIDGDAASIETDLTIDGDPPLEIKIETRLQRDNQRWLVNYAAATEQFSVQSNLSEIIGKIGAMGEALQNGIEESVDEFNQSLPAIEKELGRIESEIKQHIPELREKLEMFSRQIEQALKSPPPETPPEPVPDGAIAL